MADPNHPLFSSRRSFIRMAAIGSGSALLRPIALSAQMSDATTSAQKYGIALVGLGRYAMGQLAPALSQTKHCHLAAFVSGTESKRQRYGDQYGIPKSHIYNYENFGSIAENPDVDIVYVVLPNSMHAEYTIRAAQAGKHVICEKPLGLDVAECERMVAACEEAGVTLNVGYRLHFEPHHQVVRHLGKERSLGAPTYVHADCCQTLGDPTQWRLKKALAGGGAVYDIGIYCIQAARYATNEEPIAVTAQEFKTDPVKFAEVDETVCFQLDFPGGTVANCTCSYNSTGHRLYVAYSDRQQWIEIDRAFQYGQLSGRINGRPIDNLQPLNQQALQMDGICQSIRNNTKTSVDGTEAIRDMKVIEAIYQSIATGGQRVEI